jgi:hypothetical protein
MNTIRFSLFSVRLVLLTSVLFSPLSFLRAELSIGDDRLTVLKTLGQPEGRIEMGALERLFFDRGEIQLRDGLVSRIELVSEEVAEARREREAIESEARRERGEAIKAERLADPEFRARPAARQYAFWRDFRREFPEVDVFVQYTDAKAAYEQDVARQRDAERLANVERRVAEAERRAAQAETTARTLSSSTRFDYTTRPVIIHSRRTSRYPHWPYFPHHPPRIHPKPAPRPPQHAVHTRIERSTSHFHSNLGIGTAEPISGFSLD